MAAEAAMPGIIPSASSHTRTFPLKRALMPPGVLPLSNLAGYLPGFRQRRHSSGHEGLDWRRCGPSARSGAGCSPARWSAG
jgi:hypothetical protein